MATFVPGAVRGDDTATEEGVPFRVATFRGTELPEPETELDMDEDEANGRRLLRVHHLFIQETEQKVDELGKLYVNYGALAHIEYDSGEEGEWWIFRRYSEWLALYGVLLKCRGGGAACPKPPPKKMWSDRETISKRQTELNKWLAEVTSNTRFSENPIFLRWIKKGRVANAAKKAVEGADLQVSIVRVSLFEDAHGGAAYIFAVKIESTMVPTWQTSKRYSQFAALRRQLGSNHPTISLPPMPGRSLMVTQDVAEKRRESLMRFLRLCTQITELATDEAFLSFLDAPELIRKQATGAPAMLFGNLRALTSGGHVESRRWYGFCTTSSHRSIQF